MISQAACNCTASMSTHCPFNVLNTIRSKKLWRIWWSHIGLFAKVLSANFLLLMDFIVEILDLITFSLSKVFHRKSFYCMVFNYWCSVRLNFHCRHILKDIQLIMITIYQFNARFIMMPLKDNVATFITVTGRDCPTFLLDWSLQTNLGVCSAHTRLT